MLLSLEGGDFERFGAPILIRNTIRAYCKAVGTDPEPLLAKYSSQIEKFNTLDRGIKRYGQQMKILRHKRRMIGFPLLVLVLMTVGIVYGGMWISEKRSKLYAPPEPNRVFLQEDLPAELQKKLAPSAKVESKSGREAVFPTVRDADRAIRDAERSLNEAERIKDGQKFEQKIEPAAGQTEQQPPAAPPSQLAVSYSAEAVAEDKPVAAEQSRQVQKFSVEADDKVWIQVKIDDKETRSAMLHPGEKREWTADKSMQVVVGNAGGLRMKWNDQPVKASRDPGRVLRFRLPEIMKDVQ